MILPSSHRVAAALMAMLPAVFGCLFAGAPTPAQTGTTLYLQTGTLAIDIDGDLTEEIMIDYGGDPHTCAPAEAFTPSVDIGVVGNTVTVTHAVLGYPEPGPLEEPHTTTVGASYFNFGEMAYQLDLSLVTDPENHFGTTWSNHGTIVGTHPNQTVANQQLIFLGTIWTVEENGPGDCDKAVQVCLLLVELTLNGGYNSTTMMHGPFTGSTTFDVAFCDAPFGSLGAASGTIADLTVDDTPPA